MAEKILPLMTGFFTLVLVFTLAIPGLFADMSARFKVLDELEETKKTASEPIIRRPTLDYKGTGFMEPFQEPIIREPDKTEESKTNFDDSQNPPPVMAVQGIIWGGRFPQAIINNKVVKSGDIIDGVKIISIDKEGIRGLFEGRQYNIGTPSR